MNAEGARGGHHVLVVDDSLADTQFLTTILEDAGMVARSTTSAAMALQMASSFEPDLILLDLHMPGLDGIQLCERFKASELTRDVPIIFVSGADQLLDKVHAFTAGAVDYILKPFADEEVLARVKTHLSLRDLQRGLEDRVSERTRELVQSNRQLNAEIEGRKEAEVELRRHRDHLDELVRERTAELARARDAAEAANKAKGAFIANISHELRSPLNGILGYSQILQMDRSLTPRQTARVETIQKCGEHLLTLINDILDLAKIEASKMTLDAGAVELLRMLRVVGDIIRVRADHKGIAFNASVAEGLPRTVLCDEKRLRQVLLNILDNAVKFTDTGSVNFQVTQVHAGRLRFEIEDTGVGVAPEKQQAIFRPFEQAGDAQRRRGGTGLGLAISRELVRLMGGDIQVESNVGRGSRFWFEIDVPIVETGGVEPAPQRTVSGYEGERKRVLVVDDSAEGRNVVMEFLGTLGFEASGAANGQEFLDKAASVMPHAVVMDIHMPVMDGIDATRLFRQRTGPGRIPIIAVSATVSEVDAQSSIQAGADAFIPKPVRLESLQAHLGSLLNLNWICDMHDSVVVCPDAAVAPPAPDLGTQAIGPDRPRALVRH